MDNDWKSDIAVMSPFIVLFLSFGAAMVTISYMNGNVEIERLRLAQMQYQSEFVTHEIAEGPNESSVRKVPVSSLPPGLLKNLERARKGEPQKEEPPPQRFLETKLTERK